VERGQQQVSAEPLHRQRSKHLEDAPIGFVRIGHLDMPERHRAVTRAA